MLGIFASIAFMFLGIFGFSRTKKRRWLLLALGSFLSTSNVIGSTVGLVSRDWKLLERVFTLELMVSGTMIAIGLGLILKGTWDNYHMKPKQAQNPHPPFLCVTSGNEWKGSWRKKKGD